jgi:hypothetical protein
MANSFRKFRVGAKSFALTFEEWKHQVNIRIARMSGLEADDLPDWDFYSAWDGEVDPKEAAESVLREACEEMCMDFDAVFG